MEKSMRFKKELVFGRIVTNLTLGTRAIFDHRAHPD